VGFSAPRAVKKNCTEGCKRDFVYKYSLEEKQTHAECQHTSLGERRGHRGFVSTQLVDKASAVDQRDLIVGIGPPGVRFFHTGVRRRKYKLGQTKQ
jgi:hypothetical protein